MGEQLSSFPVACLVCFSVLPFSLTRAFLTDAVRIDAMPVDFLTHVAHYVKHGPVRRAAGLRQHLAVGLARGRRIYSMVLRGSVGVLTVAVRAWPCWHWDA